MTETITPLRETVSPHRIEHLVRSAQFRIEPAAIAARLAPGRENLQAFDIELVHRLGTTNVVWSIKDVRTGRLVTWIGVVIIVDSMRMCITVHAPFYEKDAYDITVIG